MYPWGLHVPTGYTYTWATCTHGGYVYPWGLHVPTGATCTHGGYMYPWGLHVPMGATCTYGGYMYPWGLRVPMGATCTHRGLHVPMVSMHSCITQPQDHAIIPNLHTVPPRYKHWHPKISCLVSCWATETEFGTNCILMHLMDTLPPSEFCDNLPEGVLPGIHLDHPDTGDDLVHDPHTLVRHSC